MRRSIHGRAPSRFEETPTDSSIDGKCPLVGKPRPVVGKLHFLKISIKFLDKRLNLCFISFQLNQLKGKK